MFMKNNDLNILIKIRNLIEMNKDAWFQPGDSTYNDFMDYSNLIDRMIQNNKALSDKSNEYNKRNKEYHNITANMYYAKKKGNQERYEYWQNKLNEYKKRKE